jgi:hypothetical protein
MKLTKTQTKIMDSMRKRIDASMAQKDKNWVWSMPSGYMGIPCYGAYGDREFAAAKKLEEIGMLHNLRDSVFIPGKKFDWVG